MKIIALFACLFIWITIGLIADEESSSTSVPAIQFAAPSDLQPDVTLSIPMRDGALLPTDIYLPFPDAKGLPCILLRSPAGRQAYWKDFARIAKAGYVVAIQDTRNTLDIEGKTFPFLSDGWGKLQDGYDTVEWLAKSPYTNGKVGTWGSSALGITQLLMAPSNPPSLKCQYIVVAAASVYHHGLFPGGQLLKNQTEGWLSFYARDTGVLSYVCQRPLYNEFWQQFNTLPVSDRVHVPAIHVGGWYDTFLQGTISAFETRQNAGGEGAKGQQKLVIGPWTHFWPLSTYFGDFEVPQEGVQPPIDTSAKSWFDHYLKGIDNGIDKMPAVLYYVMGPFDGTESSGNVWRTANQWPVPAEITPFYLAPDQDLQTEIPFEGIISYDYDPHNVIPTIGGRNLFLESGPKDQQSIESRDDVLVFTTEPLEEEIEVTGNLSMHLFFSSNQPDTDIVVRLCDVYPDGRSILISDGMYRLAVMCQQKDHWIHSTKVDPYLPIKLIADNPIEAKIDLWATSLVFAKGHAIRVSISSSNYPRYEKNLNVGLFGTNLGKLNIAKNTIYMGKRYPSRILLPVVRKGKES